MGAAGAAGSAAAAAATSESADYDEGEDGDGDGAGTAYLRDSTAFAAVWAGMEAEGPPELPAAAAADAAEEAGALPGHGLKRRRGGEEGGEGAES